MAEIRDLGEYLENRGVFPEQPWKKRGTVSCGEKGKMYIAQTGGNTVCCVHRVDGVIIGPKQPKCDYLMLIRRYHARRRTIRSDSTLFQYAKML